MPIISSFQDSRIDADGVFINGVSLQEKYDAGGLVGPHGTKGPDGVPGKPGEDGETRCFYGVCDSTGSTVAKTATIDGFSLETGSKVSIKFTYENTATNPTLNINSTGAIPIMKYGTTRAGVNEWVAGAVVDFVYDGTNWLIEGRHNDENGLQIVNKPISIPAENWTSVTYGNGKFVAVAGRSERALYSIDGINWMESTMPLYDYYEDLISAAYGNGKFVAVSSGNSGSYTSDTAVYSTDGINWTAVTLPSSESWQSVTYGDGKFVAVATNTTKAAYSTNGINWTATTMPSLESWGSVTYGNGKFVAIASGISAYSTNGINWTASTMPSLFIWNYVTYGDGKFVATAYSSNKAAYSTDGIKWEVSTLPSWREWRAITYGDGKFVAVARSSDKAAYSTDGINWTETTLPSSTYWQSVTYGGGKFVAVNSGFSTASGIYSVDGINWIDTTGTIQLLNGEDVTDRVKELVTNRLTYVGTYEGNGNTGATNAITLDLPFKPKIVIVAAPTFRPYSGYWSNGFIWTFGTTSTYAGSTSYTVTFSQPTETSLSYYATNAAAMMNASGTTYTYFAIG